MLDTAKARPLCHLLAFLLFFSSTGLATALLFIPTNVEFYFNATSDMAVTCLPIAAAGQCAHCRDGVRKEGMHVLCQQRGSHRFTKKQYM